ncbi:DUF485 domain-containing protein [Sphingomonas sanguinis]|uniref:DUF485 domain-containing protein n=1 Tax=Sphingomonas sp. LC-1 TaxID=3110957 RepID=UPI0021BB6B05|nr:DUF485 domain-containing protein [Sphingomonas sp. LC-1]MCT8000277.1 DUF485 domain-containing protein [Sphingomonas sp. LC-1]
MEDAAARLARDPRYLALVRRRGRFTVILTVIMLIAYFGFILTIAFDKALLARSISGGATSWGIPIGLGVIALAIFLTGLYVWRANRDFDPVIDQLRSEEQA